MKEKKKPLELFAILCLFYTPAITSTTTDIGLILQLPTNWVLVEKDSVNIRFYDTTGTYPALFGVKLYDSISQNSSSPKDWTIQSGVAHKILVESDPCYGVVYTLDSLSHDNLFGMYANTERGSCVDGIIFNYHTRFVAQSEYGYEIFYSTDTIDMKTNYSNYTGILDSIKLDRDFSGISNSIFFQPKTKNFQNLTVMLHPGVAKIGFPLLGSGNKSWKLSVFNAAGGLHFNKTGKGFSSRHLLVPRPQTNGWALLEIDEATGKKKIYRGNIPIAK